MIRAAEPLWLLLLLAVPVFLWMGSRLRTVETPRRRAMLALRGLLATCLVLALAQVEFVRRANLLTVYYLLDVSDSVPPATVEGAKKLIPTLNRRMTQRDQAGLIVFAEQPSLETVAVGGYEFDPALKSEVMTSRSDLAAAIRLAMAAFPADHMRRMVLFSDGNENNGSALEAARVARSNGIPVDVVPLRYEEWQDVSIEKVVLPQQTSRDAPFDVKIFVNAERDTRGTLRVLQDGKLVAEEAVDVKAGRNAPFVLSQRLAEGGFHKYQVTLETAGDTRPQNNSGEAFTYLKSEPRVLYVDGDEDGDLKNYLEPALRAENIAVTRVPTTQIPVSIEDLQRYDSIILSNVHAENLSRSQMQMIERGVHDLGIGLVMVGGERSFGAGGYQDTPIEAALPVSMDVKQKKMLPNGALAIVLHTCEIPSGNTWTREISIAALNVLANEDYFGLLYYGPAPGDSGGGFSGWGDHWLWEPGMQQARDKRMMRNAIKSVQIGDMPTFAPTMKLGYEALKKLPVQVKHMVIISDGDPAPPDKETTEGMRDEGITISTVGIAPHDESTIETLRKIAYYGGGNFYYPKTGAELPRIFVKEASIVRKSLISEQSFAPLYAQPSDILTGLRGGLPELGGLVITTPKDLATIGLVREAVKDGAVVDTDPVLAHWRYGLGKTVAFTSDAKNKWAAAWVGNPEVFGKFWSQLVRWSLRETASQDYQVTTEIRDGEGRVVVDAVNPDGSFKNHVAFDATVLGPNNESRSVRVRQVAPGRYEGSFPAADVGTYMVSMKSDEKSGGDLVIAGAALSYSPEYETTRSNDTLLDKIAQESGGRVADEKYNPFEHNLTQQERPMPLWPLFLLLAMVALPADIFVRRVQVEWAEVREWLAARFRKNVAEPAAEQLESLQAAKRRATQRIDEEREEATARAEFRRRLDAEPPGGQAGGGGSLFREEPKPGTAPVRPRVKDTVGSVEPGTKGPGEGGTMGSLLEAKRRAQRRAGDNPQGSDKPKE